MAADAADESRLRLSASSVETKLLPDDGLLADPRCGGKLLGRGRIAHDAATSVVAMGIY